MPSLQTVWFVLIGVLLVGYAVLDGFDLGAGIVHLFVARDDDGAAQRPERHRPGLGRQRGLADHRRRRALRRLPARLRHRLLRLLPRRDAAARRADPAGGLDRVPQQGDATGCGAGRGTSVSRSDRRWPRSSSAWPWATSCAACRSTPTASIAAAWSGLLNPFAIVMGVLTLGLAAQQGSAWLVLKTEGALQARARRTGVAATVLVVAAWIVATVLAWIDSNRLFDNFGRSPLAWVGPVVAAIALAAMLYAYRRRQEILAFLLSSLAVVGLAVTAGATLYPNLVPGGGCEPEPDGGQRPLLGHDPHGDARRGARRHADRAGLHGLHLLEVQGQSALDEASY